MPIPLGILAAAGFSPAVAGGSYDLLESSVLTSSASIVEFTNLATKYASTYQHLQVRIVALSGQENWATIRLNADSTAGNYRSHALSGNGSTVSSAAYNGTSNGADIQIIAGGTVPSPSIVDILDPFEAKNKTIRSMTAINSSGSTIALTSGLYISTSQLTEIRFRHSSSNFSIGSRFSLYGVK